MSRNATFTALRLLFLLGFLALLTSASGMRLRVHGTVTRFGTHEPIPGAVVKVYRNGIRQHVITVGDNGRYSILLENNAEYVVRFGLPGLVTKCFAVDTRGPEWEGDMRQQDLEVEMTLFEDVPGLDLGWFDMPMGMARFNPMTGHVAWSADYERRVRPEHDRLMAEVALRREAIALREEGRQRTGLSR